MRPLYIKYDRDAFWKNYWEQFDVDHERFLNLEMYPIGPTLACARKGDKILECGFGGGRVIRHLHSEGYDVEGIEYDAKIVEKVRQADPSLKVSQGDITCLKYPDNHFDLSLCFGVVAGLHHRTNTAVQELTRVTRKGGKVVISVMLDNPARQLHRMLSNLLNRKEKKQFYAWMDTMQGWRAYFEGAGYEITAQAPIVLKYNLYYWAPMLRSAKPVDLKTSRVDDNAFRFNPIGQALWLLHKNLLRSAMASGAVFTLRKL